MKKGDTVRSTGKGKTRTWGNYIGKVQKRRKDKAFVIWENSNFEDEMSLDEVELLKNIKEVTKLEFSDGMIIHTHGSMKVIEFSDSFIVNSRHYENITYFCILYQLYRPYPSLRILGMSCNYFPKVRIYALTFGNY